ncbi:MAG TPA: carboxypeptidase M32, partial [Limnochordales bacterium]
MTAPRALRQDPDFQELLERLGVVWDLKAAAAVLAWDQETWMPPEGAPARARQLATLARLRHELFTAPRMGELLLRLQERTENLPADSFEASLVRVAARLHRRAVRIPPRLAEEWSQATARATHEWIVARRENRFALFAPHLARNVRLAREMADCLTWEQERYDALLEEYEPGMTTRQVDQLFQSLQAGLEGLVRAVLQQARPRQQYDGALRGRFPRAAQERLTLQVLEAVGFQFGRGRQDCSPHPFTTSFGAGDVRLTTRYREDNFTEALLSTLHEAGHALYEQGLPPEWERTPLFEGASLGVHESQSRLWENLVGRSREFWRFVLPLARRAFPGELAGVDPEQCYRAVNAVRPGLIRTEADELTYNLHIFLRFRLERELLEGRLAVEDLPDAWNAAMESLLGLRPPDDARGVLQDIHWAHGSFGYFPSYTLGNVLAVQLYRQALQELPGIPEAVARGDFAPLLGWMRRHVHRWGASLTGDELVRRATG